MLTGCSVRADNAATLRAPLPRGRPVPAPRRGARADRPPGPRGRHRPPAPWRADRRWPACARSLGGHGATACPGTRAAAVAGAASRGQRGARAWLPIIYGCDKTCTYCIVPFSRGPGAEPPVRRRRRGGALARGGGLPGGDAARPERQLLRPRPARRGTLRASCGQRDARPARCRSTAARTSPRCCARSTACAPRTARPPIPRLRFVTSHPWDLARAADRGHGRVRRRSASTCTCRSSRATTRCCGGWAASTPPTRTCAWSSGCARRSRASASRRTSSSGSAARPRRSSRRRWRCCARSASTSVFAAAFSPRPGTPAARLPDDVPAAEKRRRLNALLALQEGIGLRAQPGLAGPGDRGPRRGGPSAADHDHGGVDRRGDEHGAPASRRQARARAGRLTRVGPQSRAPAGPPRREPGAGRPPGAASASSTPGRTRCRDASSE